MLNAIRNAGLVLATTVAASPVFAAVSTTEIDAAKSDALTVAAALVGISIAVWGALYVRRMFGGK